MSDRPRVLFHLTLPSTVDPRREAVHREVALLSERLVDGQVVNIQGRSRLHSRLPRQFWGLDQIVRLRRLESRFDLHQVFNPDLFAFPYLRFLRRPIIYSAVSGLASRPARSAWDLIARAHLVVPTTSDADALNELGGTSISVIRSGVEPAAFPETRTEPGRPFTLIMGSAPWTREQFASKGIDTFLEAARQAEDLRWLFLWRGVLDDEIRRAIEAGQVADRVEVFSQHVDVAQILTRAHAGVLLATRPAIVKAYPHSLLESLMSGRPVIVSSVMPIASLVREHRCGEIVDSVSPAALLGAIDRLRSRYDEAAKRARPAVRYDFSVDAFVADYARLYAAVQARSGQYGESGG